MNTTSIASCRKGTDVSPTADCGRVKVSFTLVMVYVIRCWNGPL